MHWPDILIFGSVLMLKSNSYFGGFGALAFRVKQEDVFYLDATLLKMPLDLIVGFFSLRRETKISQ